MLSQYSLLYAHNSSFGVIKKKKKKKELSFLYKLRNKWNKNKIKNSAERKEREKKYEEKG